MTAYIYTKSTALRKAEIALQKKLVKEKHRVFLRTAESCTKRHPRAEMVYTDDPRVKKIYGKAKPITPSRKPARSGGRKAKKTKEVSNGTVNAN